MVVDIPKDAINFKMPLWTIWFLRVAVLFGLGLCALGVVLPIAEHTVNAVVIGLVSLLIGGVAVLYCWDAARRALNQIAVDDTGIWRIPPKGEPLFIAWPEVSAIKADDTMQRLILSDQSQSRVIWLEYQLENFAALRDYVLTHTTPNRIASPDQNVFHRTWINKAIIMFSSAIWIALGFLIQSSWKFSLFAFGISAVTLATLLADPLSLTVGLDRLTILYPGWRREIFFRNIKSTALSDESNRGNVWAALVITLKQGKPLKFYRFKEGSLAMQQVIQTKLNAFWKDQGG